MLKYIFRRILFLIPVILGVITIVFILTAITSGDPVDSLIPEAAPEVKAALREELGLNDPLIVRYVRYIVDLVTKGDIGISYKSNQPVWNELMIRFPTTLKLAFLSLLVSVVVGLPLGIASAVKQYSWLDSGSRVASLVIVSVPQFWLGLMLILAFSVKLGWLPSFGVQKASGWILPVLALGLGSAANIARISRSSMLDVVRQDYIRTARAKGQKESVVMMKHGLKNALIPIITNIGGQLGVSLGGAVTIETVFSISGLGKYMLDALSYRDYPVVQGGVLFLALVFSIVNLIVDITYAIIDPRIKAKYKAGGISKKKRKQLYAAIETQEV